jgi:hypothetical protein
LGYNGHPFIKTPVLALGILTKLTLVLQDGRGEEHLSSVVLGENQPKK